MPYLIDGHNLVPKIPGLTLKAIDDETKLIELLQEFCRIKRKSVEVYFDKAPPGSARMRNFGRVTARFVRQGMTADQAIKNRLTRLGRGARNWTVVSSDLEVQASARTAHAHYISSENFARMLVEALAGAVQDTNERPEAKLDPDELKDWLEMFGAEDEE